MAEGARAGPAPVFRARELTAGTPRRRITNVFKQERLNLSGVWARVRLHGELRRVGCVFAGPAANIGIMGYTNEHYYLGTDAQNKNKSPFGDVLNKVDVSFGIGAEWEYAHFGFKLNYDFPITNSAKDSDPTTYRQHNLRMGIVYNFKVRKNTAKTEKK